MSRATEEFAGSRTDCRSFPRHTQRQGDAALCKFDLAVAIAHPIETVLSRFREGEIGFSDLLGETLLLAIDRLELATDGLLTGKSLDNLRLLALVNGLESLAAAPETRSTTTAGQLIESVTGFPPVIGSLSSKAQRSLPAGRSPQRSRRSAVLFRSLALQFESRSPLFKEERCAC